MDIARKPGITWTHVALDTADGKMWSPLDGTLRQDCLGINDLAIPYPLKTKGAYYILRFTRGTPMPDENTQENTPQTGRNLCGVVFVKEVGVF